MRKLETRLVQVVEGGKWHAISSFWDNMDANLIIHAGPVGKNALKVPLGTVPEHMLCKTCFRA